MFDRKLAKHALSLTWRFMIFFMILCYPIFTNMRSTMQAMAESTEPINLLSLALFMFMNVAIPFIIPFFAMYGALSFYPRIRGASNEAA